MSHKQDAPPTLLEKIRTYRQETRALRRDYRKTLSSSPDDESRELTITAFKKQMQERRNHFRTVILGAK